MTNYAGDGHEDDIGSSQDTIYTHGTGYENERAIISQETVDAADANLFQVCT